MFYLLSIGELESNILLLSDYLPMGLTPFVKYKREYGDKDYILAKSPPLCTKQSGGFS